VNDDEQFTIRQWDSFLRGKSDYECNKIFLAELQRKLKDKEAIYIYQEDMYWEDWQEPVPLSMIAKYGERLSDGKWIKNKLRREE